MNVLVWFRWKGNWNLTGRMNRWSWADSGHILANWISLKHFELAAADKKAEISSTETVSIISLVLHFLHFTFYFERILYLQSCTISGRIVLMKTLPHGNTNNTPEIENTPIILCDICGLGNYGTKYFSLSLAKYDTFTNSCCEPC